MILLTAADAAPGNPAVGCLALVVVAVVAALGYLWHCRRYPYKACPECGTSGKTHSKSGRSWGGCAACARKGEQPRIGTRVLNWWRTQSRGTR